MSDIEDELDRLGLEPTWRGRYWVIHCPQHEDNHKSCVCFEDGWIHCFAGCKRIHINKLAKRHLNISYESHEDHNATTYDDYMQLWLELEPLTEPVKGVPAKVLNQVGWRKWKDTGDIFIPYFSVSKTKIPFYQIRHMSGERRFSFVKGKTPITYGLDELPKVKKYLFITEGSRDSVILRWIGLHAIALPSASSVKMLDQIQKYVREKGIIICWCGDRDEAGEKLMHTIKTLYIDCRCKYKDIGEMLEAEGINKIKEKYENYIEGPNLDSEA